MYVKYWECKMMYWSQKVSNQTIHHTSDVCVNAQQEDDGINGIAELIVIH